MMRKLLDSIKFNLYFFEVVFILIVGLIPLLWYKEGFIAFGHDMGFPLAPIDFFLDRLFTWSDRVGAFGSNQTEVISGIFIHGLEAFLSFLGFSLVNIQKLAFIFWFTLPGITMYILLRSLHPEKEDAIIRMSGSLFYMLNHYLLQGWFIAEFPKFSIVAALPIVILVIINVIYKRKSILHNSILFSVTLLFLNGGTGLNLYGGIIIAGITCLVMTLILGEYPLFEKLKRLLLFGLLSLSFWLLLNLYWVYPYIESLTQNYTQRVEAAGGLEGTVNWSDTISKHSSFGNLLTLQGIPDWYDNLEHPYAQEFFNNPYLIGLTFLFPLIGFVGLMARRSSRDSTIYKIIFIALLIVAIPFTAGSHPPTGQIYDFLLKNLPGFSIFRTPFYKFGMVLWFAYAYLIAIGLKALVELIHKEISDKISIQKLSLVVLTTYIVLLGVYNYPFFTGVFFDWSKKYSTMVKVPDYIFEAKKELDSNMFSTRTLMIPGTDPRTEYIEYDWRYFSLSTIPSLLSRRPVVSNDTILNTSEISFMNMVYAQLDKSKESRFLQLTGIDKAVVQNDAVNPGDDMNYSVKNSIAAFKANADFKFDKSIDRWDIYSYDNDKVLPLIYSPERLTYISTNNYLSLSSKIPNSEIVGDSFFLDNVLSKDQGLNISSAYQQIIEVECKSCYLKTVSAVETSPEKTLPDSLLYSFAKYVDEKQINSLKDPLARVDASLGNIGHEIGSLGAIIYDADNTYSISKVTSWLLKDIEKIKQDMPSLKDQKERIYKLHISLTQFISYVGQWRVVVINEDVKKNLGLVEERMISLKDEVAALDPEINEELSGSLIPKYQTTLEEDGAYRVKVFSHIQNFDKYDFLVNGQKIQLQQIANNKNWFQSALINFKKSELTINTTEASKVDDKITVKGFNIESNGKKCQDVYLSSSQLSSEVIYTIKSTIGVLTGNPPTLEIIEENELTSDQTMPMVQPEPSLINKENNTYKLSTVYQPSLLTTKTNLRFCSSADTVSSIRIGDITLTPQYPQPVIFLTNETPIAQSSPNIEFVSLNQTKYLVKVKDAPSEYILNFNSRFDKQWKIREVDRDKANRYFTGQTKKYLNGKVIEYQRQDNHILTDYIFPNRGEELHSEFMINGFANGWTINTEGNVESEKVYLLELSQQNSAYKVMFISIIGLLAIISLYVFKFIKKS